MADENQEGVLDAAEKIAEGANQLDESAEADSETDAQPDEAPKEKSGGWFGRGKSESEDEAEEDEEGPDGGPQARDDVIAIVEHQGDGYVSVAGIGTTSGAALPAETARAQAVAAVVARGVPKPDARDLVAQMPRVRRMTDQVADELLAGKPAKEYLLQHGVLHPIAG